MSSPTRTGPDGPPARWSSPTTGSSRAGNDRAQLAELGAELNRRVLADWMAQGVGVVDPASTWVDVTAELAQDVTLEQGVLVRGTTRIGQGARVGAYAILTDAVIPAGCVVTPLQPARRRRCPGLTHERSAPSAPPGQAVLVVPAVPITDLHLRLQQSHRGPHRP